MIRRRHQKDMRSWLYRCPGTFWWQKTPKVSVRFQRHNFFGAFYKAEERTFVLAVFGVSLLFQAGYTRPVHDYQQVMLVMHHKLKELADHIEEHNLFIGAPVKVKQMRAAILRLERLMNDDWPSRDPRWADAAWDDLWDSVKTNMRTWWD